MNRIDIIKKVKDSAIEVMQDRRVLASVLIAECVLISEAYTDIVYNNPLRLKSVKDNSLLKFDNMEQCFNFFIDRGIVDCRKGIIGNYDYKSLVKLLRIGDENTNALIEIIEAYKLNEIDAEVIHNMYDGKRTIIEIDPEPFMDLYKVREAFGKEILSTHNKEEAIEKCKTRFGCSVYNSKGETVFSNALTPELKAKMELQEKIVPKPLSGTKVYLRDVNLYETPDSKVPMRSVTGMYFICDNKRYNNRYMITNKREYIGNSNFILGYINEKDQV